MKHVNVRTFLRDYEQVLRELVASGEAELVVTRYGQPMFIVRLP
jgi:hypothetical protein